MSYLKPSALIALIAMLTFAVIIGCSSGSGPVAPPSMDTQSDSVPVIGLSSAGDVHSMVGLMGAYEIHLDPNSMTADLVMKRDVAIGQSYIVSGLGFFTQAPCANCLNIAGVDMVTDVTGSYIRVKFNISHPFPPGDPSQPPTAANRNDLDVFDLAMVIVPTDATPDSFSSTGTSAYTTICAKADGYTTELQSFIADNAACPYFLVIDDSETGTSTNNVFAMGTENEIFEVFFNEGGAFDLYLTMGYGFSAIRRDRLQPKYYIPEFNRKAAWKVDVAIPSGDEAPERGNTWDDNDTDTLHDIVVNVYDWQQGVDVSTTDPYDDETDTSLVYAASNVAEVSLEIPGMFDGLEEMTDADSGLGTPGDPLVYTFSVANENGLEAGTYYGMVKVTDERVPATAVGGTDYIIDSPDGIALLEYTIPEYATYQIFPAIVVVGCGPITGEIVSPDAPVESLFNGGYVSFSADGSSDNDGDPVFFEWDMDYDGETFNVTHTGQSTSIGPFVTPDPCEDNVPYEFTVALRITDSCDPPNIEIVGTLTVTVDECDAPVRPDVFEPIVDGDTWFDIGVEPGGFVYIVADHPATGNTGGSGIDGRRTALQFTNDLSTMVVLNEGTGMAAHPGTGWAFTGDWERIAVSAGGNLLTNVGGNTLGTWSVSGNTATSVACCWQYNCGLMSTVPDVTRHDSAGYGNGFIGFARLNPGCGNPEYWTLAFSDSNLESYSGVNTDGGNPIFDDIDSVAGIAGVSGTNNILVLYDDGTNASLAIVGNAYVWNYDLGIIDSTGTYGTDNGEFQGALDVATDSAGNILTLEDHDGVFRFQKFDSSLDWIYSSPWIGSGNPMRMDFDTSDDTLYLLTDTGIYICTVN